MSVEMWKSRKVSMRKLDTASEEKWDVTECNVTEPMIFLLCCFSKFPPASMKKNAKSNCANKTNCNRLALLRAMSALPN